MFKFTKGIFDICRQNEDMANFLNLQGKLEPIALIEKVVM